MVYCYIQIVLFWFKLTYITADNFGHFINFTGESKHYFFHVENDIVEFLHEIIMYQIILIKCKLY